MMKIIGLKLTTDETLRTLRRFPWTFLSALVATVTLILMIELKEGDSDFPVRFVLVALLGISLFTVLSLSAEFSARKKSIGLAVGGFGILLLAGYFLTIEVCPAHFYRYALIAVASHLFVATSVAVFTRDEIDFWHFNKSLFLRILFSTFYSFILWVGLALAVVALDALFGVKWSKGIYADLLVFLTGIFNTLFFLSGVPDQENFDTHRTAYPKSLLIFVQFIALPIAGLYLLILYGYLLKIVITWDLPNGWVSGLVIAYSVLGILAYLLMYPLKNEEGNKWISVFAKWFFITLLPLLALMSSAIWARLSDYGITEPRYFLVAANVWLYGISAYFIVAKNPRIRTIPLTLAVVCLGISFGPWGVVSYSEQSQMDRLERILTENQKLVNGKIIVEKEVPKPVAENARSIIQYLDHNHKFKGFKEWLAAKTDKAGDFPADSLTSNRVIKHFGLENGMGENVRDGERRFTIYTMKNPVIPQEIYANSDVMVKYNYQNGTEQEFKKSIATYNDEILIRALRADSVLAISFVSNPDIVASVPLYDLAHTLFNNMNKKKEEQIANDFIFYYETSSHRFVLVFDSVVLNRKGTLAEFKADIFIKRK